MALEDKAGSYCWHQWDEGTNAAMERHRYLGEKWELCHPVDVSPTGCCSFSLCNRWLVAFPHRTMCPCSLPQGPLALCPQKAVWFWLLRQRLACLHWCLLAVAVLSLCMFSLSPHFSFSLFLSPSIPVPTALPFGSHQLLISIYGSVSVLCCLIISIYLFF